ncbi:DUF2304 domain-containing protein [Cohnella pontilimi]|uniref:DUF2304 domain-containing protein n=1 Tax=Cohnella pontilimi TaxID=2564100 RepID=A0A4U0F7W5_9BACL|nr:DUF2304 domain-containing protein [Cohnella pontilimi]TJY40795.1 DUF2304 domain-containing protein [Cohnella pontilimi]
MEKVQIVTMALSLALLVLVLQLIRRRYLREQYSLLWLFFCAIILVFSLNTKLLDTTAALLGFKYAPSLLFLVGITLCLLLILHLTVVVSRLAERIVRLTQELGIMKHDLEKYEQGADRP